MASTSQREPVARDCADRARTACVFALGVAAVAVLSTTSACTGDVTDSGDSQSDAADTAPSDAANPVADGGGLVDSGQSVDASTGQDASTSADAGGAPTCDQAMHSGEGTYYDADGSGACSFPATPDDLMVGAMNLTDYADSAVCGTCLDLTGPSGSVTVRVVDLCPECAPGDVDLSPQAFEQIADLVQGRVAIDWRFVPCDVVGPIRYHFKEGSNQWWSAVQIRNHRHQIASLEYLSGGSNWVDVPRLDYNFFVEASGMGPGPYTFRVTDIYGQVLEDSGIEFVEGGEVEGSAQFPPCAE